MKKYSIILLVLILISSLISCGTSDNDNGEYTEEFTYLPSYGNMELVKFEEATSEGMDRATYTVKNTTPKDFLTGYEKLLSENGWEKTNDNKPVSINMEKENHKAIILATPTETTNDLTVMIFSD